MNKKIFKECHIKTMGHCYVRQEPDFGSVIIYMAHKNSIYTIVEQNGDWGKLKAGGWIYLPCTTKYKLPTKPSGIVVL